jgi:oligopeptide/dipeptide ABC transporter ATP-binding protein
MTGATRNVLLHVEDLTVQFKHGTAQGGKAQGTVDVAVDRLSLTIDAGETVALVGESGCGKSTTALALMGLIGQPEAIVGAKRMQFAGRDVRGLPEKAWQRIRGGTIAMIFQDPLSALNPVRTVGWQIEEAVKLHQKLGNKAARAEALALLHQVGIPEPERRLGEYPHRLSGGMRQRILIAIALAGKPQLLIADEPTTALDVTIQSQILSLLDALRRRNNMALLLITHDLAIVGQMADRVVVMYAGKKVEEQPTPSLLSAPRHPYTQRLLGARPRPGHTVERLVEIKGAVPRAGHVAHGCPFAERCDVALPECRTTPPPRHALPQGEVHCYLPSASAAAVNQTVRDVYA